jgi:hypothetical protein
MRDLESFLCRMAQSGALGSIVSLPISLPGVAGRSKLRKMIKAHSKKHKSIYEITKIGGSSSGPQGERFTFYGRMALDQLEIYVCPKVSNHTYQVHTYNQPLDSSYCTFPHSSNSKYTLHRTFTLYNLIDNILGWSRTNGHYQK